MIFLSRTHVTNEKKEIAYNEKMSDIMPFYIYWFVGLLG